MSMNPLETAYDLWDDAIVNESEEWNHHYGNMVDWIRKAVTKLERMEMLEHWFDGIKDESVKVIQGGQATPPTVSKAIEIKEEVS